MNITASFSKFLYLDVGRSGATICKVKSGQCHRGIALLEASAWLLIASALIVGAVVWGNQINEQAELEDAIRNSVKRQSVAATQLDVKGRVAPNIASLVSWAQRSTKDIVDELSQKFPGADVDAVSCFWIASTEQDTGTTDVPAANCSQFGMGATLVAEATDDVSRWFSGSPALAAIPNAETASRQFLEFSVAAGVSVRVYRANQDKIWSGISNEIKYVMTFLPSGDVGI